MRSLSLAGLGCYCNEIPPTCFYHNQSIIAYQIVGSMSLFMALSDIRDNVLVLSLLE